MNGPTCAVCLAKRITSSADVHKAKRSCPCCSSALCNSHSRRYYRSNGKWGRVCGMCHTHMPDEQFRSAA